MIALGAAPADLAGLWQIYEVAVLAGDLPGAERVLADPRIQDFGTPGGVMSEPATLRRAMIAFLLGQHEAAAGHADDAIATYRTRAWTPRQRPYVLLGIAEAEAYAGRPDAAIRDGVAAANDGMARDPSDTGSIKIRLSRIYAAVDRRDEALALVREAMGIPGVFPLGIYDDPVLVRLKDDPRLEQIIKSAKAF